MNTNSNFIENFDNLVRYQSKLSSVNDRVNQSDTEPSSSSFISTPLNFYPYTAKYDNQTYQNHIFHSMWTPEDAEPCVSTTNTRSRRGSFTGFPLSSPIAKSASERPPGLSPMRISHDYLHQSRWENTELSRQIQGSSLEQQNVLYPNHLGLTPDLMTDDLERSIMELQRSIELNKILSMEHRRRYQLKHLESLNKVNELQNELFRQNKSLEQVKRTPVEPFKHRIHCSDAYADENEKSPILTWNCRIFGSPWNLEFYQEDVNINMGWKHQKKWTSKHALNWGHSRSKTDPSFSRKSKFTSA